MRWSDDVHITVDAADCLLLSYTGHAVLHRNSWNQPNSTSSSSKHQFHLHHLHLFQLATPRVPIAAEPEPAEAELLPSWNRWRRQPESPLSDSNRREGNAEESLLTPDEQVTGCSVSDTRNTSWVQPTEYQQQCAREARRKRNKVTRLCYDSSGCQLVKK